MIKLLEQMYKEQISLNDKLFPEWKDQLTSTDWFAEMMGELVEAMESTNHKWWANKKIDKINLIVEIVDVWHFFLSSLAYYNETTRKLIFEIVDLEFKKNIGSVADGNLGREVRRLVVNIFQNSSLSKMIDYKSLVKLTKFSGIESINQLYDFYLIKKTLNQFRKDNGYKRGKYIKNWFGEEDNHFIFKWYLYEMDSYIYGDDEEFKKEVYKVLTSKYKEVLNGK